MIPHRAIFSSFHFLSICRPDFLTNGPDLRSEMPDLGSERPVLRLQGGDGHTDRRKPEKIALCGIIGHRPLRGRCPKGFNQVSKDNWFQLVPDDARPTRMNARVEGGEVVKKQDVLVVERARLEIRRNFYSIRAAKAWNELPEAVKNTTSINGFKNAYDKWRTSQPMTEDDVSLTEERNESEIT